jgi:hypothetical protein
MIHLFTLENKKIFTDYRAIQSVVSALFVEMGFCQKVGFLANRAVMMIDTMNAPGCQ